ncbi:hypothetical protein K458DRAFT_9116 [Lentithecium fluviatile CBS 122367]|uniref:Uncharacterized protein n=1 Tax=Lentithecium fluviatile CBS 122367 TaxID=1168545 RepID=A0A6G1JN71_9PLEO|nr:hypothetical protein K458DRAFT_9116 [Lentithecium fluviatile CBS 122367]
MHLLTRLRRPSVRRLPVLHRLPSCTFVSDALRFLPAQPSWPHLEWLTYPITPLPLRFSLVPHLRHRAMVLRLLSPGSHVAPSESPKPLLWKGYTKSECRPGSKQHTGKGILVTKETTVDQLTVEKIQYRRADCRTAEIICLISNDGTLVDYHKTIF